MTHAESARRRAAVKADFLAGMHAPEIAAKHGISREWCSQIAKEAGIPVRPGGKPKGSRNRDDCPRSLRAREAMEARSL